MEAGPRNPEAYKPTYGAAFPPRSGTTQLRLHFVLSQPFKAKQAVMAWGHPDMAVRPRECPRCGEPFCFAERVWNLEARVLSSLKRA
jgi:hypothetical protein